MAPLHTGPRREIKNSIWTAVKALKILPFWNQYFSKFQSVCQVKMVHKCHYYTWFSICSSQCALQGATITSSCHFPKWKLSRFIVELLLRDDGNFAQDIKNNGKIALECMLDWLLIFEKSANEDVLRLTGWRENLDQLSENSWTTTTTK